MCDLKSSEGQAPTLSQKLVREYVRKLLVNSNILKFRRAKKDKDKNLSSPSWTKYGRLGASKFSSHQTLNATMIGSLSQLDLDGYSSHPSSCLEC